MPPDQRTLLADAVRALELIVQFTADRSASDYDSNVMLQSAVERQFTIAGEALAVLRQTSPEAAAQIPGLAAAIGLRNVLVHGYAAVDDDVVWRTAKHDIAPMLAALRAALEAEE